MAMQVFELQGVNFENKGAELMLRATQEHFASVPNLKLALPFRIGSPAQRNSAGLLHLLALHREPPLLNTVIDTASWFVPGAIRRRLGVCRPAEMSGLIDASGFLYSDQWPIGNLELQARKAARFKAGGKPVIYLPQAFGPFKSERARDLVATIVQHSDLVFARDKISYEHLVGAAGQQPQIRIAPDFTNLVEARITKTIPDNVVFIVPNARMIDKSPPAVAERYVSCLAQVASSARDAGLDPVIMIHDAIGDRAVGESVQKLLGQPLAEMTHPDPQVLKGWLAQARGVVGSRFHAIVSALSSGTPAIALGWSHKYGELMADYGLAHLNLGVQDEEKLQAAIAAWADRDQYEKQKQDLKLASNKLKAMTKDMWKAVDDMLFATRR
ncbi:MAG: polysaccharide pyruvyl transferase family protein [Parvibaculaceae bacterium]|nr:polysaccharide pyruvyl transferase family protein [Parvibaculaceae bacterium]